MKLTFLVYRTIACILSWPSLAAITSQEAAIATLLEGTASNCEDTAKCDPNMILCPQDMKTCCRSCLSQCEAVGGKETVNVDSFLSTRCSIPREAPNNWSRPDGPFIFNLFSSSEADTYLPWDLFTNATGVPVKTLRRPMCGKLKNNRTFVIPVCDNGGSYSPDGKMTLGCINLLTPLLLFFLRHRL
jgi:hypothetical protein